MSETNKPDSINAKSKFLAMPDGSLIRKSLITRVEVNIWPKDDTASISNIKVHWNEGNGTSTATIKANTRDTIKQIACEIKAALA